MTFPLDARRLSGVVAVCALLLAGCAQGTGSATSTASDTPATTDPATTSATPSSSTSAPAVNVRQVGAVLDVSSSDRYRFASPTGNIVCQLDKDAVQCAAADRQWTPTPTGKDDCKDPNGDVALRSDGRAVVVCHGDSIGQRTDKKTSATVLDYGHAVKKGDIMCLSQTNGVTCSSNVNGASIFLSRERYEVNGS
ncbi:DUF6636 domain-containing protein [Raineyella fluvialis]|uniref:Lipoprotein n=1 Tax=Raineyella fluvialis TaxID=2662261 RepID=A0A5Q2FBR7_9ACTN|nr:DUF6636 domain-containing protein [Raineyella fluvialis]QGF22483.1 hypothetical protein Rai3103_00920 [Raineyella fluvialis]